MKKIISVLMSVLLITLSVADGFYVLAIEDNASKLDAFAEGLIKMIRNYDNKPEEDIEDEDSEIEIDLPIEYTNNSMSQFYSGSDTDTTPEEDNDDFSTARLIIKSKQKIDYQGAVDCISGYKNLYVLQFETPEKAKIAYDYYNNLDSVEYVEPDVIMSATNEDEFEIPDFNPDIFDEVSDEALSWVSQEIGFESIKEELSSRIQREVMVAVIDSGVDTDHEYLEGRLLESNVNLSSTGDPDSCEDDYGHGTHVTGILADNTLDNVKIKPYKVLNNEGKGTISLIAVAVDMAVADGAQIINLSLSAEGDNQTLRESIESAVENGVNVVVAAGNNGVNLNNRTFTPACIEAAVTVSAVDKNFKLSSYSNYNKTIDIAAPGDNIMSSYLNNTYSLLSGTSMAAPQVAAGFAVVRSVYLNKSAAEVEKMVKEYAIKVEEKEGENKYGAGIIFLKYILQAIPRTASVQFSVVEGNFDKPFTLTLSCLEEDAVILYAINMDGETELGYLNGTKYSSPIKVSETTKITAVAISKGKLFSIPVTYSYKRLFASDDEKYEINSSGIITDYYGIDMDIVVPEKIRGITVKGIGQNVFKNDNVVRSVSLPETVTRIYANAFYGCTNLETVTGSGINQVDASAFQISTIKSFPVNQLVKIGSGAFSGCNNLETIDLSNAETVESSAFENTKNVGEINNSTIKTIGKFAFRNSDVTKVNLSKATTIGEGAFAQCRELEFFEAEQLNVVAKDLFKECTKLVTAKFPSATTLNNDAFYNSSIRFIDLPEVTKLNNNTFAGCSKLRVISLPKVEKIGSNTFRDCQKLNTVFMPMLQSLDYTEFANCESLKSLWLPKVKTVSSSAFVNSHIEYLQFDAVEQIANLPSTLVGLVLPSTVKSISATTPETDFIVYGFTGTFAQEYADNVERQFCAVPSLVYEMPQQVSVDYKFIYAYALGYNCTYQWYENDTVSNEGGTPIEGANKFFYEPNREDGAVAYYCVITSNDGISETVFVTAPVENAFEYREADYTEYQKLLSFAESIDRKLYTEESLSLLDEILSVDISGYSLAEQSFVDEHISAIEKAIELLELAFKYGDINDDGVISLVDARMALQAVSQTITLSETQTIATDVNKDGKISLIDARMILQAVAGVIEL